MIETDSKKILDKFWISLSNAENKVLMLDYDGTLAPFVIERNRAKPYPFVPEILNRIIKAEKSKVIVISGRSAGEVADLLALECDIEIWGSHGMERITSDGNHSYQIIEDKEIFIKAYDLVLSIVEQQMIERKHGSIVVHVRGVEKKKADKTLTSVKDIWQELVKNKPLELMLFDGGIEIRSTLMNKGLVIDKILSEYPKDTIYAYVGDDRTDEDAFRKLKNKGLTVLMKAEKRDSLADLHLIPPDDLETFLKNWDKFH